MRLVAKFTGALVGAIILVLTVGGVVEVRREVAFLEDDMARDQAALARTLRAAAESVARRTGPEGAEALIAAAGAAQRRVRVQWIRLDPLQPGVSPAEGRTLRAGRTVRRVLDTGDGAARRLTLEPVTLAGKGIGALALSEPLAPQREAIRETQIRVLGTTIASVLTCALLALTLGAWLVGRPMRRVCDQARRVGEGDLSERLPQRRSDEIGLLSGALNDMVDQLAAARDRVAAETRARIVAIEQLRHADRLRTVGQLAAGVAHELGTPLGVAGGRAKMIASHPEDATAVVRNATIVHEQVERMTRIVRQLLDFSRRRPPALAVDDLAAVTTRTADMLSSLAAARRVRVLVEHDGSGGVLPVAMDGTQIEQALANLIVNAVQAMPAGGTVRVGLGRHVGTPPPEHGGATGEWCTVAVRDEGDGIAPEHLERLFEPFFTTKEVGQGTGLGLAVTWGIVRDHGGWIDVDSAVGRGTTIRVHLPEAQAAPSRAAAVA